VPPSAAKQQILWVVEDDPSLREFYRSTLVRAGYTVVAVEDGLDALRLIDLGNLPAVIMLDMGLPRLRGQDVQAELRANPKTSRIPIVVVTGVDTPVNEMDFTMVLRKPIPPDALVNAVAKCLRQAT